MKNWLDKTFFLTEEEISEGYEVSGSEYLWVTLYILFGLIGMLMAFQALSVLQ